MRPLTLQIQRLAGFNEQVLVLLHVAELRNASRAATPSEIAQLFAALRLPPPSNERQHLTQLKRKRFAMQPGVGVWATTPEGREQIRLLMGDVKLTEMDFQSEDVQLAGIPHRLIPWPMAPAQFQAGISRFLQGHPFEQNVFCMTRYPDDGGGPLASAIEICRAVVAAHALELHLASDRTAEDLLLPNVAASMWACRYGIVVLEDLEGEGLNYNAIFEAGAMLMTGRRCLLLKDVTAPELPTNLVGHIYKSIDLANASTIEDAIAEWITSDLGLA